VAITSARAPLRKGPRPRIPTGGDNEAIKAKELEARRQVPLMVSPVEATTSATGSLTSGGDHLSTNDSAHLCTGGRRLPLHAQRGLRSRPHCESEDKTIQERGRRPPRRTASCTTPRCGRRRGRSLGCGGPTHGATIARAVDGQPRPDQVAGGSVRGGAEATQAKAPGTRRLAAPAVGRARVPKVCLLRKAGKRPSPPNARGRSEPPAHAEGGAPTRLALLPGADDENP
jgi:hypothetical protein